MGSPLTPVPVDIFMGFSESKWLNEYNLNKPKFYLKYFGDILAAFGKKQNSISIYNKISHFKPIANLPIRDFS